MFQFSGNSTRPSYDRRSPPRSDNAYGNDRYRDDSYRPQDNGYAPGTSPGSRRDSGFDRYMSQPDVYRPNDSRYSQNYSRSPPRLRPADDIYRPPEGNFSFRAEAPASIDFRSADTQRPRSPIRQREYQPNNSSYRGNNNFRQRGGHGYRGRGGPRLASERAFLQGNRAPTPELMAGMEEDVSHGARYIPIEDVSDSSEAEMDLSDDEGEQDDGQPKKKQARIDKKAADGDSAPRWSNPDPYTVLPPPDETQRKKKDVVKLIRKARVEAASTSTPKVGGHADDFISFDFGDEPEEETDDEEQVMQSKPRRIGVDGAPTGPRQQTQRSKSQIDGYGRTISSDIPNSVDLIPEKQQAIQGRKRNGNDGSQKLATSNLANTIDLTTEPSLGSRKRTIRDEIKETPTLRDAIRRNPAVNIAPKIHKSLKGKPSPVGGEIVRDWAPRQGSPQTPWMDIDHSDTAKMGVWLHKEIVDFYEFVKPREFENFIRSKLVEDLQMRVRTAYPGTSVQTFGSFPAGLYLPTADMDVVWLSPEFMNRGRKVLGQSPRDIRGIGKWLEREGLPAPGSLDLILHAKVPLVKYVDRLTGLKVDISFENTTGLTANKTFQDWKSAYPAMPILVTVIKHLLAMRGLNEPVNGGIGGFSVICLVVSLLQLMPQVQSRTMVAEHHLGEILMEFLDLYGNQFNVTTTAIQFDPPGYVSKAEIQQQVYKANKNLEKFCILDPNDSRNDIAGGSSNTATIRLCFSRAYNSLQKRMGTLQYSTDRQNQSILSCILGGNYGSFELQREHLSHLHENLFGPIRD